MIENLRASVAYGTAVVGYDLLTGVPEARTGENRVISNVALTGGAAAGDCGIEVWVDSTKVGTYFNTGTSGAADRQRDLIPSDTFVKAGALIQAKVIDAAPSGVMVVQIEFSKPKARVRRFFKRTTTTRRSSGFAQRRY